MDLTVTSRSRIHGSRSAGSQDCCNAPVCQAAAGLRVHVGESAALAVLAVLAVLAAHAAHAAHAQALGIDRVGAQRGDVGVTVLPGQNDQRDRAQQVGQERRVVAGERQRTSLDPVAEESGGGQELAEENELAQRRCLR